MPTGVESWWGGGADSARSSSFIFPFGCRSSFEGRSSVVVVLQRALAEDLLSDEFRCGVVVGVAQMVVISSFGVEAVASEGIHCSRRRGSYGCDER